MVRFFRALVICLIGVSSVRCVGPSGDLSPDGLSRFEVDSLRSGDLVCRLGNGFFSGIFRRYSGGAERFSHIGVVHREGDSCFVIHAEASELTGIGSVRKDPLPFFADESLDLQFYAMKDDSLRRRVDSLALLYLLRPTPFDLSFDMTSDSSLYCTELVAVCINHSLGDDGYVPAFPIRDGFSYYRIDDILHCGVVDEDTAYCMKIKTLKDE